MTEHGSDPRDLPPRQWSSLFLFIILAAALMMGGIVLLGIPGALIASVTAPLVELVLGMPAGTLSAGDRAWPLALVMTILFPPGIPLSFWLSRKIWPQMNRWWRALVIVLGTWIWSLAMMAGVALFG